MHFLVLGGTVFLGRHVVDAALARGHDVTIFHRGNHAAHRPADVDVVLGDRDGGLGPLRGRTWDAVVDTSGYVPRLVRDSARLLADSTSHYTFVSTISVYADVLQAVNEDSPVHEPADDATEDVNASTYGPLKVACERAVTAVYPGRILLQRPGLIAGPHDPTDRFTYWVRRAARGGRILAPADRDAPVQWIDVRDLADWTVQAAEQGIAGTYNAVVPHRTATFADLVETCLAGTGSNGDIVWVDKQFLLDAGVTPWQDLPLWLPAETEMQGMLSADASRAAAAGLRTRPLLETVEAVHAWDLTRVPRPTAADPALGNLAAGLTPAREEALLRRWLRRSVEPPSRMT